MRRLLFILLTACTLTAKAQVHDIVCRETTRIDTTHTRALGLRLNTLGFFHDNEYSSQLTKGYSLPGARITPAITYNPIQQVHLEVGAAALVYNGANKYPCYAYHDIAKWKGNQYQKGMHILPWVRAQIDFRHLSVVVGNIYGGANHRLIEPLYNPEHNLSADPEMGFQLILNRKHIAMDTWMDWQSYIFNLDSHQEAFTVGSHARLLWNAPTSRLHWYTPIQLLIQHRGGEQDTTALGVQTICNASLGVGLRANMQRTHLTRIDAEVNAVASYQQSGTLWPFDTGMALHAQSSVTLWDRLNMRIGYVGAPRQYVSLYGSPLYGTLSIRPDNYHYQYSGNHTLYSKADYCHTFGNGYALGAQLAAYKSMGQQIDDFNFHFGIYLRIDPTIILKRF